MMIVVFYAAIACACVAPFVRMIDGSPGAWIVPVLFGSVAIPMAWSVLTLLVLRRGPIRDWLAFAFLAAACANVFLWGFAGLVFAAWQLVTSRGSILRQPDAGNLLALPVLLSLMGYALAFLGRRAIPYRCPSCGRRFLLRDAYAEAAVPPRGRPFLPAHRCLNCNRLFLRVFQTWRSIDDPMPDPEPLTL